MWLKNITLNNFMQFKGEHTFNFDRINFIRGKNGKGKTTIAVNSLLYVLYGYTAKDKTIEDLPYRGDSKCSVEVLIQNKNNDLIIKRDVPSTLNIILNKEKLTLVNLREKTNYIKDTLGDTEIFKKLRMIDKDYGIDILSESDNNLKKLIFVQQEQQLNELRSALLKEKLNREQFAKKHITSYSLFPSEKRLNILNNYQQILDKQIKDLQQDVRLSNSSYINYTNQKTQLLSKIEDLKHKQQSLVSNICYVCGTVLKSVTDLQKQINQEIKNYNDRIMIILEKEENEKEHLSFHSQLLQKLQTKQLKTNTLILKLENRLQQKCFCYTDEDILIAKEAIKNIDNFSTDYLVRFIKQLEPIINSIIIKIGYKIEFKISEKQDLEIVLYKNNVVYKRSDLSSGEKLMLQIAFKMALLMQRNENGLIVCDEGLSSLDSTNLQYVLDLFNTWQNFQLVCILHNVNDLPSYVNIIEL